MQTKFSKTKNAYERTLRSIEDLAKNKDLPDDLIVELFELSSKFKTYDINAHREKANVLTGEVLTSDEALKAVVDATGYNRWSYDNSDDVDNEGTIKYIKDTYGVDFDESNFVKYSITRETRSRDDFWLVSIYAFAGHCWYSMDTGRADACIDRVIKNEELATSIEANFN